MQDVNYLTELFFSTSIYGYIGPFILILVGYYVSKEDKNLGIFWFLIECLFVAQYLDVVDATPYYWWHVFIILLGGIFFCVLPFASRRK